jgi:hypothetical protein
VRVDPTLERSRQRLEERLAAQELTAGLLVRVHGRHLTLVREEPGLDGAPEVHARVRLTHLGQAQFGVSVLRHTGKWERTPFSGSIDDVVEVLRGPM